MLISSHFRRPSYERESKKREELTQSLFRQIDLNLEEFKPIRPIPCPSTHPIRPPFLFQQTQDTPFPFVSDQVRQEPSRFRRVPFGFVRERESELEGTRVSDGFDKDRALRRERER